MAPIPPRSPWPLRTDTGSFVKSASTLPSTFSRSDCSRGEADEPSRPSSLTLLIPERWVDSLPVRGGGRMGVSGLPLWAWVLHDGTLEQSWGGGLSLTGHGLARVRLRPPAQPAGLRSRAKRQHRPREPPDREQGAPCSPFNWRASNARQGVCSFRSLSEHSEEISTSREPRVCAPTFRNPDG